MGEQNLWPDKLEWDHVENRHIIRTFLNQAIMWWKFGQITEALELLKQLLQMDFINNAGARFYILAIRLEMSFDEYDQKFSVQGTTFLSGDMFNWFDANYRNFPEQFCLLG